MADHDLRHYRNLSEFFRRQLGQDDVFAFIQAFVYLLCVDHTNEFPLEESGFAFLVI